MEREVTSLLLKHKITITTAESCTGGMIAAALVAAPGISSVFEEGYITYSNQAKEKLLGVSHETLLAHGAVSLNTAQEMACGAKKAAHADISLISTGIAGPDGGTREKPVGLVYLACACKDVLKVERHIFEGNRQQIRQAATEAALALAAQVIKQEYE